MHWTMIKYGLLAGGAVLLAVAYLRLLAAATAPVRPAPQADITQQIWEVLAEARRIAEESA
jgi:hypothetical protein